MTEFANRPEGRTESILGAEISRRALLLGALGATANFLVACDSEDDTPEKEAKPDRFSETPSFEQDFTKMPDGPVDPAIWTAKLGPEGYDGAGQQIYTNKPENIYVKDGRLVISAFEQEMSGKPFTSGRIDTLGKQAFGFGRLVVRAQMPAGKGTHPAIWMRRVPKADQNESYPWGEIDIVEYVGHRPDRIFTNLHTTKTNRAGKGGIVTRESREGYTYPPVNQRMVEYGLERTADGIAFFVDGKQVGPLRKPIPGGEEHWPFGADEDYYLILNIAVADRWARGLEGVDRKSDPWQMQVESIRFFPEKK